MYKDRENTYLCRQKTVETKDFGRNNQDDNSKKINR